VSSKKHDASEGACLKCAEIFNKYPGFNEELKTWFFAIQIENPDAHISCAGRGEIEQEEAYARGASKAHYGQSAHNANAAIDIFRLFDGKAWWPDAWYLKVVEPNLYPYLEWYGKPDAKFKEKAHVEVKEWRQMLKDGKLKLVEPA
jgi:hypothetical protein